jgi:hypothetical protein
VTNSLPQERNIASMGDLLSVVDISGKISSRMTAEKINYGDVVTKSNPRLPPPLSTAGSVHIPVVNVTVFWIRIRYILN